MLAHATATPYQAHACYEKRKSAEMQSFYQLPAA